MKNRIIKFRAWDKKEMVLTNHPSYLMTFHGDLYTVDNINGVTYHKNDDWILMQFTGLLDSKNVEIFEGDIVEWSIFPPGGDVKRIRDEVIFSHGSFAVKKRSELLGLKEPHRELLVIGNVFESEHLLKEANQDS